MKSITNGEIIEKEIDVSDGEKFNALKIIDNGVEYMYKDYHEIFQFRCDNLYPTKPSDVKKNMNGCVMNIDAKNLAKDKLKLHDDNYLQLPPTELSFKFSEVPNCKVISVERNCSCMEKCPTKLHVSNYPCYMEMRL